MDTLVAKPSFFRTFNALGNTRIYQTDHVLTLSGNHVYLLERGFAKVIQPDANGTNSLKYIIRPGDVFGSLAFLLEGNDAYREYAVTVGLVQLTSLTQQDARRLCETDPSFRKHLYQAIGQRIVRLEKRTDVLLHGNAEQRVIFFIMDYVDANGVFEEGQLVAPNLLTHHEISTLAVTSRQTVTKVLNRLREQGLIHYDSKRIVRTLHRDSGSAANA
ncbi:MAG TPA: Crp/Fnr family transcriptional regulator [Chitinophagales bacterium]|nr:Crp/Fnr family transcriptional regulator [Chitinophagales bacterium]